jgi:hypothetical protein
MISLSELSQIVSVLFMYQVIRMEILFFDQNL